MTNTFQINVGLTPAEFQFLYRSVVLLIDAPPPVELVQKLHNIRLALQQPIIDLKGDDYGAVPEEGIRNSRVSDEPVWHHAGQRAH
jgi:hypothetical protein